jgi:hypothetical protein
VVVGRRHNEREIYPKKLALLIALLEDKKRADFYSCSHVPWWIACSVIEQRQLMCIRKIGGFERKLQRASAPAAPPLSFVI